METRLFTITIEKSPQKWRKIKNSSPKNFRFHTIRLTAPLDGATLDAISDKRPRPTLIAYARLASSIHNSKIGAVLHGAK